MVLSVQVVSRFSHVRTCFRTGTLILFVPNPCLLRCMSMLKV